MIPKWFTFRRAVVAALVAFVLLAAVAGGYQAGAAGRGGAIRDAVAALAPTREHLAATKNRELELVSLLEHERRLGEDRASVAASLVAALRDERPTHFGRIELVVDGRTTSTSTVNFCNEEWPLENEPNLVSVLCELGELTVGEALFDGFSLSCTTYQLGARASFAVGERSSSALVELSTSASPDTWIEVPAALEVTHTATTHRLLKPALAVGFTGGITFPEPGPELAGSLSFQWLHPSPFVDVLGVRVSGNTRALRVGVDLVGIRPRWRMLENTGLYAGVSYGSDGKFAADLSLLVYL